jgi:hypothetical protein
MNASRSFLGLGLLPAAVAGAALRLAGLRQQVLTDDELHTVGAVLAMSPGEILRSFSYDGADYCVPLSALYRLLIDQGVVLGDLAFRAPSLIAGLLALVIVPALLAPRIGERAAVFLAWGLAISPMLVLYSRIARPYMLVALLVFLAVLCFDTWLRTRSRRAATAFVLLASLSTYLHLGAGPLVVAPFVYAGIDALRRGREGLLELRSVAVLGAIAAVAIALPLLPALDSLIELVRIRRDGQLPPLAAWAEVVPLQAGTSSTLLGFAMMALAARGAWLLRQRDAALFGMIATVAGVHVALLLLLSPDRIQEALVLSRYLLFLLPFGLTLAAIALANGWELANSAAGRAGYAAGVAALALGLLSTGPLLRADYRNSAFTHTPSFLRFTEAPDWIPGERVPPFYHELYALDDDAAIIEHPWMRQSSHALSAYQSVHQKRVLVSSVISGHHDPRIELRNLVEPTTADFLDSGARYVVVHLDLRSEAEHVVSPDPHHATWLKAIAPLWKPLRSSGRNTAARLERELGPAFYQDQKIAVWDLDAARAERSDTVWSGEREE